MWFLEAAVLFKRNEVPYQCLIKTISISDCAGLIIEHNTAKI